MTAVLARLDRVIAETQDRIAHQASRITSLEACGRDTSTAARALACMRLDLVAYRQSRAAVAESRRLLGTGGGLARRPAQPAG